MSGAPLFTPVIFMKVNNFITLLMFALNFVLFFNLFTLFLNLTINMQLLYFITTVTSQVHSARHHQRAGYSALLSV